jgi:hypothetical protein
MSIKKGYHFNDLLKDYYTDADGNKRPEYVCLCAAKEPAECACDCTSWIEEDYEN